LWAGQQDPEDAIDKSPLCRPRSVVNSAMLGQTPARMPEWRKKAHGFFFGNVTEQTSLIKTSINDIR
jgi:hypothetical protein